MKKRKVDSILGYTFQTNYDDILWRSSVKTYDENWKKKKATRGEVVSVLKHLVKAIQRDLVDIAEGTITIPDTGEGHRE